VSSDRRQRVGLSHRGCGLRATRRILPSLAR